MTSLLRGWGFNPEEHELGDAAASACRLRFDLEERHWLGVVEFGTWWVLPFARSTRDDHAVVGLRPLPGRPAAESPVVETLELEVETVASSPAVLVPTRLVETMMLGSEQWDEVRTLDEGDWRELTTLHEALGGVGGLERVREAVEDSTLKAAVEEFEIAAFMRLWATADPSPETVAYREYLVRAVDEYEAPLPPPGGAWAAAATSVAFAANTLRVGGRKLGREALESAWLVASQPASLDSFQHGAVSLLPGPSGRSPKRQSLKHATYLMEHEGEVDEAWRQDPLWPALRELAADPDEYRGLGHIKASQELVNRGELDRAFVALQTSAYWIWAATRQPFPKLMQGGIRLARDLGSEWAGVTAAFEALMDKITSYDPPAPHEGGS